MDKNSYLDTDFALTFLTVDHITDQLNKLGPGSHLYKVDFLLIELIKFGFPLDFNPQFHLACDAKNHASAVESPTHVDAHLEEDIKFDAILGSFQNSPIKSCNFSPFMTREKSKSVNRHVIIDF